MRVRLSLVEMVPATAAVESVPEIDTTVRGAPISTCSPKSERNPSHTRRAVLGCSALWLAVGGWGLRPRGAFFFDIPIHRHHLQISAFVQ